MIANEVEDRGLRKIEAQEGTPDIFVLIDASGLTGEQKDFIAQGMYELKPDVPLDIARQRVETNFSHVYFALEDDGSFSGYATFSPMELHT